MRCLRPCWGLFYVEVWLRVGVVLTCVRGFCWLSVGAGLFAFGFAGLMVWGLVWYVFVCFCGAVWVVILVWCLWVCVVLLCEWV